ncbi:Serine/threonine-protein phosphatase 2A regulatory subunit A beta isoform [Thalictrum thalictroides]|uniref:Serine/threonine-protein phosphatase 2A regulatory subunit A beta isoform n=1 Tax=Thalictrum thalictroides TaxID=46969 RepID=A0A7J6WPF3_THATH|nr:Serine/threonine-protein phosphatase 2A regulatory subunit A beta isoform [Thalictrum thalictroides]
MELLCCTYLNDNHGSDQQSSPNILNAAKFAVEHYNFIKKIGRGGNNIGELKFIDVLESGSALAAADYYVEHYITLRAYDIHRDMLLAFSTKVVQYEIGSDSFMESIGLTFICAYPILDWIPFELLERATRMFHYDKHYLFRNDGLTIERFQTYAQEIGEESTRDYLIKSLLTDQLTLDNTMNDLVLSKIAELLGDFVPYVGGIQYAHYLLKSLEILCTLEDNYVREKAVESLCKIAEQTKISNDFLIDYFIPLVKVLATGELFTARASSCGLFHIAYPNAPEKVKAELRFLYSELCKDNNTLVKRSAAYNFGKFVDVVEPFHRKTDIITMFKALTQDDIDIVRLYCIVSCAPLMKLFEPQVYAAHILPVISKLSQDTFWRVRYTIADHFLEFCKSVTLEATRVELISMFVRLVRDEHSKVRLAATLKVSALCEIWTTKLALQDILFRCVKELSFDSSSGVRAALFSEILSMALVFGKDVAIEKLLPVIRSLLADESSFVQLNVISKIDQVAKVVGIDQLSHQLVDVTDKLASDTEWLVRYEITKNYIPLLASHLNGVTSIVNKLKDLCKQRMEDEKPCVCDAAEESFKRLAEMDLI